jgi:hypothetical protein
MLAEVHLLDLLEVVGMALQCHLWRGIVAVVAATLVSGLPAHAAPVDIATGTAGLQLWFDASQRASLFTASSGTGAITPAGSVGFWGDLSGQGGANRNATQGSGTSQPTWQTNVINGKAVVRFDGSNDFVSTAAIPAFDNNSTALSWFVVGRIATGQTNQTGNLLRSSYAASETLLGTYTQTGTYNIHSRTSTASIKAVTLANNGTTPSITTGILTPADAGSVFGFINGVSGTTATGANIVSGTHRLTRIGASSQSNAANPFNGDIAEVLVYTSSFNTAQRLVTENYLGAKYAITLSGNQVTGGNYLQLASSYRNDVIGIGRAADGSMSTAGSLAGLRLSGELSGTSSWVFAGNGDAYNATTSIQTANALAQTALPPLATDRWSRIWNLTNVGTLTAGDAMQLLFDWEAGGLANLFDAEAEYALLYSPTPTPESFSILTRSVSFFDPEQRQVAFDLSSDDFQAGYYTIAIVPEPGGAALGCGVAVAWAIGRGLRRRPRP